MSMCHKLFNTPFLATKKWQYCAGYNFDDKKAQTRLNGTSVSDLGDIFIMPFSNGGKCGSTNCAITARKAIRGIWAGATTRHPQ
jgi:hypothetical protein